MSYESDLYEWTKEQADALRRRASNALDWDNLAEEIESLAIDFLPWTACQDALATASRRRSAT